MTDATGHSLRVLVRAYSSKAAHSGRAGRSGRAEHSGRVEHRALGSGCHLHMGPCGRFEAPFADSGHGRRILRRSCLVHSLPAQASWDRGHNKTAAGADLAGPSPASTPLQSPHFLVVVKRADCAVYNAWSGL